MNSGKQSFYEIQLNNSSLIVAFLIAVALGVAVFMLGVKVGRGQAPQTPDDTMWVENFPGDTEGQTAAAGTDSEQDQGDLDFGDLVQEPVEGATANPPVQEAPTGGESEEEAAEPAAATATPTTTVPAPAGLPEGDLSLPSGWVVQVKATPREEEAYALQEALERAGFRTFVVQTEASGQSRQTQYRVRVGRYRSKTDAEAVAAVLAARPDITDTWVTEG